jgi:hypothetical protein
MRETKIVPSQVRELAVIGIDNAEKAILLFSIKLPDQLGRILRRQSP